VEPAAAPGKPAAAAAVQALVVTLQPRAAKRGQRSKLPAVSCLVAKPPPVATFLLVVNPVRAASSRRVETKTREGLRLEPAAPRRQRAASWKQVAKPLALAAQRQLVVAAGQPPMPLLVMLLDQAAILRDQATMQARVTIPPSHPATTRKSTPAPFPP